MTLTTPRFPLAAAVGFERDYCLPCRMTRPCVCDAAPAPLPDRASIRAAIAQIETSHEDDPEANRQAARLYRVLLGANTCGCLLHDCPLCNPEAALMGKGATKP